MSEQQNPLAEPPTVRWGLYELVWVTNWWDWELSGVARQKETGKRVYFDCIQDDGENRKFACYDPPNEIWKQIDQQHKDFQKYVGTHWDFESFEGGVRRSGKMRPDSEHHKFYDKYLPGSIKMRPEWQLAIADSAIETEP